jgi:hypothetical protein
LLPLIAHDNARCNSFPVTREFLAMMWGVKSIAAKALQQAGRYVRGP